LAIETEEMKIFDNLRQYDKLNKSVETNWVNNFVNFEKESNNTKEPIYMSEELKFNISLIKIN